MPLDFRFLVTDVETQKEIGRQALKKAEEIERLLRDQTITDENARRALEESKAQLFDIASSLARNANQTTATANSVLEIIKSST